MFRKLMGLLLVLEPILALAQDDTCLKREKDYVTTSFDPADFLASDQGILVGDDLELNKQPLDPEQLTVGLQQPFYVDYLSEGGDASSLFGFFFLDIDTDKDGFPDFFETAPSSDLDGDGLANSEDDDDDGDGILDTNDTVPSGVISMPAVFYQHGEEAEANSMHGNYWQFVPNSVISEGSYRGYYEHPGAYLYIDKNGNEVPDVLEYKKHKMPPYATDKGYNTDDVVNGGRMKGLLSNDWAYQGTPGTTTADKYHWTGSTIYYITDDDEESAHSHEYDRRLPYQEHHNPIYGDIDSAAADAAPDYLIYGTNDPNSNAIPPVLTESDGNGGRRFVTDDLGQEMYRYRWYESNISGTRELVFFLTVFYRQDGHDVHTFYSKSAFNPDIAPYEPEHSATTTGDQYGRNDAELSGDRASNWFPNIYKHWEAASLADMNDLAVRVWGGAVTRWEDVATLPPYGRGAPQLQTGDAQKAVGATQEWVDQWENLNFPRRVIQYRALADWFNNTPVDANTIINGRYHIDMSLEGDSSLIRAYNSHMVHLMVGAPTSTENAWLLGWEDLFYGGDRDFEDVVFYVKRRGGGELVSLNVAEDISAGTSDDTDYSISQVNFSFDDNFLEDLWGVPGRYLAYFYRLSQNDEWIVLLGNDAAANGHHLRTVDKFQPAFGGSTVLLSDGVTIRRTVSLPVEEKKQELYWKVQMASEHVDAVFQPKVTGARVGYQSLIHDFYYNGAVIPNSNINYIAAHETPSFGWNEAHNRGHIYALQSFVHGNPPTATRVGTGDSPELTPMSQPVSMYRKDSDSAAINLYKWDAGVTMNTNLQNDSYDRVIYSYTVDNTAAFSTNLNEKRVQLNHEATTLPTALVEGFEFSSDKTTSNVWVDNYHNPTADIRDTNAAALWLINWIHGRENPIISDTGVESPGVVREWVLGGVNRASPTVIRAPGRPTWLSRSTGISVADKRAYLAFTLNQKNMPTRILIGTESGLIHCIDAGQWVGKPKLDPETEEEYRWSDGHFKDDNYGTGEEKWAMLPGHLLNDIKYNYTHARDIVGKSDATAVTMIAKDGSTWKRLVVFTQGYKAGTQTINETEYISNVVWAMDLTDIDNPIPLWQRSDTNTQDIVNPVAMGWMMCETTPRWVAVYPTGGSPVTGQRTGFHIVDAFTGESIRNEPVGSASRAGLETMLGTPALMDTDGDGFVDHVFGATSEGYLYAFNTAEYSLKTVQLVGKKFYLAPNIGSDIDGNVEFIAVSGDNPLIYDEQPKPFTNTIYYYKYEVGTADWTELGSIDLPENHKAFSRPKLVGNQLVVGTTTGDTFNFCDADPDDPGSLLLYDLTQIGTEFVLDYSIDDFGSVLAPIVVADNRVLAHGSRSPNDNPNAKGSVFSTPQAPDAKETLSFSIADLFGVASWQDDLIQALQNPSTP